MKLFPKLLKAKKKLIVVDSESEEEEEVLEIETVSEIKFKVGSDSLRRTTRLGLLIKNHAINRGANSLQNNAFFMPIASKLTGFYSG